MSKLKPLMPTLKEKKRYLVYEVLTEDQTKKNLSIEIFNVFGYNWSQLHSLKTEESPMDKLMKDYLSKIKYNF